ncbi:MAG: Unknown protein [uncultured Thiotrichaceae bacterium]|uniref:Uncharacterized protein n=1 Tax=uncultured Thiotrichaceae bacterium TaxID=298394 RepID=A0A6S6SDK6_9GAMM|nr:MAG: Unknown protein [uncultured Thiotrichaceae bacterium]
MKNLYILLISLACSTAVLAQTPDTQWADMTDGQSIVEEVLAEEVIIGETSAEEMMTEDEYTLSESEQMIGGSDFPEEMLLQIQQDCSVFAQNEGVEEEFVADFVDVCVIDSVATELADNQEEVTETEILAEAYAEAPVEDELIETVAE